MRDPRIRPFLWGLIDRWWFCTHCWGMCRALNEPRRHALSQARECHTLAQGRTIICPHCGHRWPTTSRPAECPRCRNEIVEAAP